MRIEDALRLDALEREHLRSLVGTPSAAPRRAPASPRLRVRVSLQTFIDAIDPAAGYLFAALTGAVLVVLAALATLARRRRTAGA